MYDPQLMRDVLVALVQVIPTLVLAYAVVERPKRDFNVAPKEWIELIKQKTNALDGLETEGINAYDRETYSMIIERVDSEAQILENLHRTRQSEMKRFHRTVVIALFGVTLAVLGSLEPGQDPNLMQAQLAGALFATFWVAIEVGIAGVNILEGQLPGGLSIWPSRGRRAAFWVPGVWIVAVTASDPALHYARELDAFLRSHIAQFYTAL